MKQSIFLLTTLLIIWIAGSAYVYVCKIRDDCGKAKDETVVTTVQQELSGSDVLQVPDSITEIPPPMPLTVYFNTGEIACVLSDPEGQQIEAIAGYIAGIPAGRCWSPDMPTIPDPVRSMKKSVPGGPNLSGNS